MSCSGCTDFILRPDHIDYSDQSDKHLSKREGFFKSPSGANLHFWLIKGKMRGPNSIESSKGLVVIVHGNGKNLTSHIHGVAWLADSGFDVFIFDFRGHGKSTGRASLNGSLDDVIAALDFSSQEFRFSGEPLFFYGQSLGATLLLKAMAQNTRRWPTAGIIVEDPIYSFKQIAREKMATLWFTSPVQWLAYVFISDHLSLKARELVSIKPTPVVLFCAADDPVVPSHHCAQVGRELVQPKKLFVYPEKAHVRAMWSQGGRFRKVLIGEMESSVGNTLGSR